MMNDLIMNPSETGVLQDSSQFNIPFKGNGKGLAFSLDWMLTVPSFRLVVPTTDVTKPVLITSDEYPYHDYTSCAVAMKSVNWNTVPFAWATYTRRRTQITVLCVKPPTPMKLQLDWAYSRQLYTNGADIFKKRNFVREVDATTERRHVIDVSGVYDRAYKLSSVALPVYSLASGNTVRMNLSDDILRDGWFSVTQIMPNQRGMIYPDQFNIFIFVSYAGSTLSTIISPNATVLDPSSDVVLTRYIAGTNNIPTGVTFDDDFPIQT